MLVLLSARKVNDLADILEKIIAWVNCPLKITEYAVVIRTTSGVLNMRSNLNSFREDVLTYVFCFLK